VNPVSTPNIVLRRYLIVSAAANLIWEFAQLPLYTIWRNGTPAETVFAAVHCTGGDILIAICSLIAALILTSNRDWPARGYIIVAALAVAFGLAYMIFSEWLNTEVRHSWAYSDLMPRLPLIGTGLSPMVQWLLVPMSAFWLARPRLDKIDTLATAPRASRDQPTT
jgi:hypothetical protein